jgi:hypothetical protein
MGFDAARLAQVLKAASKEAVLEKPFKATS